MNYKEYVDKIKNIIYDKIKNIIYGKKLIHADYTSYVSYLEARNWERERLTLGELNSNIVTLSGVAVGATGTAIEIRAPAGQKISIMGTQQIPRGADARSAHALRIRLADTGDGEIPIFSRIRITKEKTSKAIVQLARIFYADVSLTRHIGVSTTQKTDDEWYKFKQSVELNGEQKLKISLVNTGTTTVAVDADHIKFALDIDLWTRKD